VSRPGQAAFGHDFVKDPQQIEVQCAKGGGNGRVHVGRLCITIMNDKHHEYKVEQHA
jgi:hypothetical protein